MVRYLFTGGGDTILAHLYLVLRQAYIDYNVFIALMICRHLKAVL